MKAFLDCCAAAGLALFGVAFAFVCISSVALAVTSPIWVTAWIIWG